MRKSNLDVGAIGALNQPFRFSTRDLQQQIKNQSWMKADGVKALEGVLSSLERKFWIEIDGDNWMPRSDLLNHRW